MNHVPKLLTSLEAAEALRMSYRGLQYLLAKGQLRSVRIGRRLLFDPADIRAFIESNKTDI